MQSFLHNTVIIYTIYSYYLNKLLNSDLQVYLSVPLFEAVFWAQVRLIFTSVAVEFGPSDVIRCAADFASLGIFFSKFNHVLTAFYSINWVCCSRAGLVATCWVGFGVSVAATWHKSSMSWNLNFFRPFSFFLRLGWERQ